jgi:CspA family cold shock protein
MRPFHLARPGSSVRDSVSKVNPLNILKIVHLLTGAAALLLSFIPSLRADALPYLQQPDALYLAFCGLLLAPVVPAWTKGLRNQLQSLVSALLVLAVILQTLILLAPLPVIGEQPAILVSLFALILAVALHLAINLRKVTQAPPLPQDMSNRETGTVKWFNTSKGFGFISRDSGDDIFVHFRAIRGEGHRVLIEGQRVEFSVIQRDKGLQAEDVIAALPGRR